MSQQELYDKIMEIGFVLYDVSLFLDTHPTNQAALDFYSANQDIFQKYRAEYETQYGPLSMFGVNVENGWTWTQGPWPWEMED